MKRTAFTMRSLCASAVLAAAVSFSGCNGSSDTDGSATGGGTGPTRSTPFLSLGTAPVGGAFNPVGVAISETLNNNRPADTIYRKVQAKGTKGSQHNIRQLDDGTLQLAMSNSAISYFAVRGEKSWEKEYDIRAVVTMAPNVAMFITKSDSGITTISDLKGRKVCVGPAGAGFDMFVSPILEEHGVGWDEIKPVNATQSGAVDLLSDGGADAAFLGGAVPTGSITQAASTFKVLFVPFDPQVRAKLVEKYPFFSAFTIPRDKYKSALTEDFSGLNVGSMHLITSAGQSDELIYQLTKSIWENREDIAGRHPAGRAINEKNAARYTGTDFHPGAIRFYKEIGIWPEAAAAETGGEASEEGGEKPADNDAGDGTEAESAAGDGKAA